MVRTIKNLNKMSFHTRIRLGMFLAILLIIVLGMSVTIWSQSRDQIRPMDEFGRYIAENLAQNSKLGLLSEEPDNLKQPLRIVMKEHQVVGASIYQANGKLLCSEKHGQYSLDNFDASKQVGALFSNPDHAIVVETQTVTGRPLRSYLAKVIIEKSDNDIFNIETEQEKFYGFVRVDMSLYELKAKKAAVLYQNILALPVYLLIGMLFSVLIERRISKPLTQVKTAVAAIAEGDFNTRINIQSEDEIGVLANSFNNMSEKLSTTIDQLNRANETLEKANQELQDFTYIVSHDLQEPLRKVHSFGQFLFEDCNDQLSDDGKDYVSRMQNASMKMKTLIQDLLKLSRIGAADTVFKPVNIKNVIDIVLDDLSVAITESDAEIIVGDLPDVMGQDTMLIQLFENILGNALKYRTPDRKPRIEISAEEQNGRVTFSIKDNGIGIEDKFKDKIFGVFQRLHSSRYEGTGIGLALCKKVIDKHGGKIWVESDFGKETTFYFTLKSTHVNLKGVKNG